MQLSSGAMPGLQASSALTTLGVQPKEQLSCTVTHEAAWLRAPLAAPGVHKVEAWEATGS